MAAAMDKVVLEMKDGENSAFQIASDRLCEMLGSFEVHKKQNLPELVRMYLQLNDLMKTCERMKSRLCTAMDDKVCSQDKKRKEDSRVIEAARLLLMASDTQEGRMQRDAEFTRVLGDVAHVGFFGRSDFSRSPHPVDLRAVVRLLEVAAEEPGKLGVAQNLD